MEIYDCFLFNDELDHLDIRFNELSGYVDYFVLAESSQTFTGKKKPLYFQENYRQFKRKFRRKVIYIEIPWQESLSPWHRQFFQRSFIQHALTGKAQPQDFIMLSDADEIAKASKLTEVNFPKKGEVSILMQRNYKYFFNCRILRDREPYIKKGHKFYLDGTKIVRYNEISTQSIGDLQNLRVLTGKFSRLKKKQIVDAGWHFSYFGDVDRIVNKMQSCSAVSTVGAHHIEKHYGRKVLEKRLLKGEGLFGKTENDFTIIHEPFGDHLPQYVVKNRKKFEKYVFKV